MHQSSFALMRRFAKMVEAHYAGQAISVLDIGSTAIGGSYRDLFRFAGAKYVGLDIQPGPNVDIVVSDPYRWDAVGDNSYDVVISGQVLEHVEYPWLVFDEIVRALKTGGLTCLIAPSRGPEHRYPLDCYRYYPDGMKALARWSGLSVIECDYMRASSGYGEGSDQWGDCHCIATKAAEKPAKPRESRSAPVARTSFRHRSNPLSLGFPGYFGNERPEVLELLSTSGIRPRNVLELGCAAGRFAKHVIDRLSPSSYVGVEGDVAAAEQARAVLKTVHVVDINDSAPDALGIQAGSIDLLIALDVLEHLVDPWEVLATYAAAVKPGGHLLASIPNVAHASIIQGLCEGRWRYEAAGLLDATHLRFFTRQSIVDLCAGAGFAVRRTHHVLNPVPDLSRAQDADNTLTLGPVRIAPLTKNDILNLFTQQYVVLAERTSG
jgi:SAM-dependent methyltransferase